MSVLGTNTDTVIMHLFTGTGDELLPSFVGHITLSPSSHHYDTSSVYALDHADEHEKLTQMRPCISKGVSGAGILTSFPFDAFD